MRALCMDAVDNLLPTVNVRVIVDTWNIGVSLVQQNQSSGLHLIGGRGRGRFTPARGLMMVASAMRRVPGVEARCE